MPSQVIRPAPPAQAMFRRFLSIASTAFTEAAAEPVSALVELAAVLMVHLAPAMQYTLLSEPGRMARDGGFSALLVFGAFFSVSAGLRAVGRELSSGTAAAALARPVPRPLFLAGKIAGVLSAFAVFAAATLCATAISQGSCIAGAMEAASRGETGVARVSGQCLAAGVLAVLLALAVSAALHRFRRARFAPALFRSIALFQAVAAAWVLFSGSAPLDLRMAPAALPVAAYVCVLAVAASAMACRFRPAFAAAASAAMAVASAFMSLLPAAMQTALGAFIPDFRNFWLADALAGVSGVPWRYSMAACAAALPLSLVWFAAGCALFRSRDIG